MNSLLTARRAPLVPEAAALMAWPLTSRAICLSPLLATAEVESAGFEIVELRDPFIVRPPDEDGKSRWWILIARKPKLGP